MNVSQIMQRKVMSVTSNVGVRKAYAIMNEHNIRHLPVTSDGKLIGIISDRDIRPSMILMDKSDTSSAYIPDSVKVESIMVSNPLTINRDDDVRMAARIMQKKKLGCLPVMDGDKIVGLITETDLIRLLVEMLSASPA